MQNLDLLIVKNMFLGFRVLPLYLLTIPSGYWWFIGFINLNDSDSGFVCKGLKIVIKLKSSARFVIVISLAIIN